MLVPLTRVDASLDQTSLTFASLFQLPKNEDGFAHVAKLEEASQRVPEGLRLKFVISQTGRWAIDIPDTLDALERPLFGFTTADRSTTSYQTAAGLLSPLSVLSSSSSTFLPYPDLSFFRHPSTPKTLADHARGASILHIHCTIFSDALAVGISLPHGIFDGHGDGLVIRALVAELHNQPWDVPPLFDQNPMQERLEALVADKAVAAANPSPPTVQGWGSFSVGNVVRLISTTLWEKLWWRSEGRFFFLRREAVDLLVQQARAEVAELTSGEEYVSTGDVVTACILKALHVAEFDSPDSFLSTHAYNLRTLLDDYQPSAPPLAQYLHNCASLYPFSSSPFPLSTLACESVGRLALRLRRSLLEHRTLPVVRKAWAEEGANLGASPMPLYGWPQPPAWLPLVGGRPYTHQFIVTNQTSLGLADLALPGRDGVDLPLLAFHLCATMPLLISGALSIQEIPEGLLFGASMRQSRFESLGRAMEQLEREVEADENAKSSIL
ncbi:hypothetical protein JCM10207_007203 [Rhodosporidiobolus poonsookiae]